MTGATVKALKKGADSVTATIEAGGKTSEITVDRVILAVGIVGNVENLGLEGTKVKVEKTHVVIDEWCSHRRARRLRHRRSRRPALARAQGEPRGRDLRREDRRARRACIRSTSTNIPGCTYCRPQVASVGLTEAGGQGGGPRGQGRPLPLHRQRQGDRAGRAGGHGQDRVRRQDRRAAGRAHDRRRGDRADPGLRASPGRWRPPRPS